MALEQKEVNKNYILANIDKYIIDGHDNFVHTELELGHDKYYLENYNVNDFEEVREKVIDSILKDRDRWGKICCKDIVEEIMEIMLQEIDQWKIVYYPSFPGYPKCPNYYEHTSGKKIAAHSLPGSWDFYYVLLGELGYRERLWKNYGNSEEKKKFEESLKALKEWKRRKKQEHNKTPSPTPQPNIPQPTPTPREETLTPQKEQIALNQEKTNSKTSPSFLPTINTFATENSDNTTEATLQQTEQQINQLLINNKLQTTDLPKEYQNWVEQLKSLTTKEELSAYAQKLEQTLAQLTKQKQQSVSENKGVSLSAKLGISSGAGLTISGIIFLALKRRTNLNSKKRK